MKTARSTTSSSTRRATRRLVLLQNREMCEPGRGYTRGSRGSSGLAPVRPSRSSRTASRASSSCARSCVVARRSRSAPSRATTGGRSCAGRRDRPRAACRLQQVEPDRSLVREHDQQVHLRERERLDPGGRAPGARRASFPVHERHRHQRLRHVARALGACRAKRGSCWRSSITIGWPVTSTQPAMPVLGGKPHPDQVALALARDGLEDELVRRVVEEEDRRRLGAEDRPRDVDDRLQRVRGGSPPTASIPVADRLLVARPSVIVLPPAFDAVR